MIEQVTFDEVDGRHWALALSSKSIATPSAKTYTVELEGADGQLDFTDSFGEVKYNNRSIKLNFTLFVRHADLLDAFSQVCSDLHGQVKKIWFATDPFYYYKGRLSVGDLKIASNGIGTFTVTVDADPYKYHAEETQRRFTVSGSLEIELSNDRMKVLPIFTASADGMTVTYDNGETVTEYKLYKDTPTYYSDIELPEGETHMTLGGTGTVYINYQQGRL